jgi:predicted nuclease with TOPRIM domain
MRTYREATLAEKLRELQQRRDEKQAAEQAFVAVLSRVPDDMRILAVQAAYLRGYDDRQSEIDALQAELAAARQEFAEWLDASRKALDTHAALQERVRELEAELTDTQVENAWLWTKDPSPNKDAELEAHRKDRQQPAAVGVVGAVRWGVELSPDNVRFCDSRKEAEQYAASWSPVSRVVAIVDPAQIVPLASGDVKLWMDDNAESAWDDRASAIRFGCASNVTPLYPGIAQPAQERAG